jgi:hypothetical protein
VQEKNEGGTLIDSHFGLQSLKKRVNNKNFTGILAIAIILNISIATASCSHSTPSFVIPKPLDNSIVQVWRLGSNGGVDILEAMGIVVGDGTTVLTIINYEDHNPGESEVVSHGHGKFAATTQAIDSRTGATLLKLDEGRLPVVKTGDATTLKTGDKLMIWAQAPNPGFTLEPTEVLKQDLPSISSALTFNVYLAQQEGYDGVSNQQGAVVADQSGKVFGLESVITHLLAPNVGGPGSIPPVITINSALELLSPNANGQPWANGPLLIAASEIGSRNGIYDGTMSDYVPVVNAITQVLSELGGPLSISDLPQQGFFSYVFWQSAGFDSPDGSTLITAFPKPVELRNFTGTVLAQAKWVGIQWDRDDGKPSRVVYGNVAYVADGSFEITGETSSLDNDIRTLLNDPTPYGQ